MNFFSFVFMLILWGILSLSVLMLLKNDEGFARSRKNFFIAALLLSGMFLPIYAKVAISKEFVFASSDEDILKQNYEKYVSLRNFALVEHASGPSMLVFMQNIQLLTGLELDTIVFLLGLFLSALTPAFVFFFFLKFSKSYRLSLGAAFLAFFSSFFIWPTIEVRPQQAGFLIALAVLWLFKDFEENRKPSSLAVCSILTVSLSAIHVLSFYYILPMLVALTVYFIMKNNGLHYAYFFVPVLAWVAGIILNNSFFYIIYDLQWALRYSVPALPAVFTEIILLPYGIKLFVPVVGLATLLIAFIFAAVAALKWLGRKISVKEAVERVSAFVDLNFAKIFAALMAVSLLMLAVQVLISFDQIMWLYSNSLPKFVFLELGNIFFGAAGVGGLLYIIRNKRNNSAGMLLVSLTLAGVFASTLLMGIVMTAGFNNFALRTLNYLVIFLAFFAFYALTQVKMQPKLKYAALLILLFFPATLALGTRDPGVLNIVVTYFDVEEAKQVGFSNHFIVVNSLRDNLPVPTTRGDPSIYYNDYSKDLVVNSTQRIVLFPNSRANELMGQKK